MQCVTIVESNLSQNKFFVVVVVVVFNPYIAPATEGS